MAIKINNITVVTDSEELDCSNSSIVFQTATNATLPSSNTADGDTVFNTDTNSLMVFCDDEWFNGAGGFRATGGDIIEEYNGRKYHIFTSPGNFTVESKAQTSTDFYVVAIGGGGGGGRQGGGGGGAGQIIQGEVTDDVLTPANNNTLIITIGSKGLGGGAPGLGDRGGDTQITLGTPPIQVTALGGGRGGAMQPGSSQYGYPGGSGASGGGGGAGYRSSYLGGTATAGNSGGAGNYSYDSYFVGGGGGGFASFGSGASGSSGGTGGGAEGISNLSPTVGTPGPDTSLRYFAGGGNGTGWYFPNPRPSYGGGGGSTGSGNTTPQPAMDAQLPATNALPNTGSGGGGRSWRSPDVGYSNGADGIVIIHYVPTT